MAGLENVTDLRSGFALSRERMGRLIDVSSKTIERWEKERQVPNRPALIFRLDKLRDIYELGTTVYSKEGFRRFLQTPLGEFGGKTALQFLEAGEFDVVLSALASDYEGAGY